MERLYLTISIFSIQSFVACSEFRDLMFKIMSPELDQKITHSIPNRINKTPNFLSIESYWIVPCKGVNLSYFFYERLRVVSYSQTRFNIWVNYCA